MAGRKRMCQVNAVCGDARGESKGEARWWFKMTQSPVDYEYYPQFAEIDGPAVFGVACCEMCKTEIERRASPGAVRQPGA